MYFHHLSYSVFNNKLSLNTLKSIEFCRNIDKILSLGYDGISKSGMGALMRY